MIDLLKLRLRRTSAMIYITVAGVGNVSFTSAEWADVGEAGLVNVRLALPIER
jgi:hypothetical protein